MKFLNKYLKNLKFQVISSKFLIKHRTKKEKVEQNDIKTEKTSINFYFLFKTSFKFLRAELEIILFCLFNFVHLHKIHFNKYNI